MQSFLNLRILLITLFTTLQLCLPVRSADSNVDLESILADSRGLCVVVGTHPTTKRAIPQESQCEGMLVHLLVQEEDEVHRQRDILDSFTDKASTCTFNVEYWTKRSLPHASRLANLVVINDTSAVDREEAIRILQPGGMLLELDGDSYSCTIRPKATDTDEWTHQWHSGNGSLTTEDKRIGVPTGLQWVAGPLFAMAGRKSSTQTLVSSGGINFYVTQNVSENVGKPIEEMTQFLLARDAYNGLILWKKPWNGPFVVGNGETNPRMIATQERLYFVAEGNTIVMLDSRSGERLRVLNLTSAIEKLLLVDETLLVQSPSAIIAFDSDIKEEIWSYEDKNLTGLTVSEGKGFVLSAGRSSDGRFQHTLIGLNIKDGSQHFTTNTQPHVTAAKVRINFASDGFVALQAHGFFHMFSADGKHLWTKTTEARPGKTYVDERYVGHFYRNGLVWMLSHNSPRESEGQNTWLGLNPKSGKLERELTTQGNWPKTATPAKMGCQVLLASDQFIMIPRQSTFIDFETGNKHSFKFTRGGCGLGFVPANGLLYSHPHACGCFSEAIRGFMGMHSEPLSEIRSVPEGDHPLTVGLSREPDSSPKTEAETWSTYRGDAERRGAATSALIDLSGGDNSLRLEQVWSRELASNANSISRQAWRMRTGNTISATTIAANKVFSCDIDSGKLYCIDLETGETTWMFRAAGRLDSPPTLKNELCVFGSHDGCVYCLESSTGRLVWKHRVAPNDRRIIAYGNLESAWPITGATLVRGGTVYVASGRAPDADGGISVAALDLYSGQLAWREDVNEEAFWGLSDLLVAGNNKVFLSNWQFEAESGKNSGAEDSSQHLRGGKVGLLEASWSKHDLALRKDIQTWTAQGVSGQLLAFNDICKASYHAESNSIVMEAEGRKNAIEIAENAQVTALALTNSHLIYAGGKNRSDELGGGFVKVFDLESMKTVASTDLKSEVVLDGISVSKGHILVASQDGVLTNLAVAQ